ncbi:hypothetical protein HanRHA438_Chr16g0741261 [Helianthus annuus]|uniref:Uncharacterized protein n=1 Tax=Helianthus annuus TaxID=4232 RepID=A0A9K3GYN0_HELAN|nr:hypothetical protein HanXRQr2_Chr16g0728891 [Helianthus annuus]KAJ0436754.1 hypothetical protein HanHA300_Chr16g0594261 [Helianthus annuus]KAJ0440985.1 hypothetical protein HanIR_Chr16g0792681 [Helianthus annuus]KAJ0459053.1 hypothetical protein HanHA89_Chr16g0644581 [Helianthus annuus]KAJ0643564.1 hypothetical protein HanOQP8_Chr16g0601951 [Helianthus annuus]
MWVLEIFPQFKRSREWFEGETIPRFLGWKEGKKFMRVTVDGMLQLAVKKREFKPPLFILPTENELRSMWYLSSSDYLDAERRMYANAMPGKNPVPMAAEIPIQMPTNFPGPIPHKMQFSPVVDPQQLRSVMNTLFGDDGANQGFNPSSDRQEIPQQNFVPDPSTFGANYENDMISKFKSLLDENNRKIRVIMSEVMEAYRSTPKEQPVRTPVNVPTPKEQSHTQSDNVTFFVKYFFIIIISTNNP